MGTKEIRTEALDTTKGLQDGTITTREADKVYNKNSDIFNKWDTELAQIEKALKLNKQSTSKEAKNINTFTLEVQKAINDIKLYVVKSAEHIIKIREILNSITGELKRGTKRKFYNAIGMSDRTAQRYMKIASNSKIQQMKKDGKLENLNLSKMLILIGENQEASKNTPTDFSKVAQGIYARYKEPAQLESIIDELTKLLDSIKSKAA